MRSTPPSRLESYCGGRTTLTTDAPRPLVEFSPSGRAQKGLRRLTIGIESLESCATATWSREQAAMTFKRSIFALQVFSLEATCKVGSGNEKSSE